MNKPYRRSRQVQEALKRLGNPYASLQIDFAEEDPDLRPLTDAERAYVRRLGDQYASLSIGIREPGVEARLAASNKSAGVRKVGPSDAEFSKECRKIFRQYIPAVQNGRLRPHHEEFIVRNRSRPPKVRGYLLFELRKYDLSSIQGLQAQFNRERDELAEDKLTQIELKVIGEE